jgi:hypothetical protein
VLAARLGLASPPDRLAPEDAFRFARGEQLRSSTEQRVRLEQPYDGLVVSDHAEYMGLPQAFQRRDPDIMKSKSGAEWATLGSFRLYHTNCVEAADIAFAVTKLAQYGRCVLSQQWRRQAACTGRAGELDKLPGNPQLSDSGMLADCNEVIGAGMRMVEEYLAVGCENLTARHALGAQGSKRFGRRVAC